MSYRDRMQHAGIWRPLDTLNHDEIHQTLFQVVPIHIQYAFFHQKHDFHIKCRSMQVKMRKVCFMGQLTECFPRAANGELCATKDRNYLFGVMSCMNTGMKKTWCGVENSLRSANWRASPILWGTVFYHQLPACEDLQLRTRKTSTKKLYTWCQLNSIDFYCPFLQGYCVKSKSKYKQVGGIELQSYFQDRCDFVGRKLSFRVLDALLVIQACLAGWEPTFSGLVWWLQLLVWESLVSILWPKSGSVSLDFSLNDVSILHIKNTCSFSPPWAPLFVLEINQQLQWVLCKMQSQANTAKRFLFT